MFFKLNKEYNIMIYGDKYHPKTESNMFACSGSAGVNSSIGDSLTVAWAGAMQLHPLVYGILRGQLAFESLL